MSILWLLFASSIILISSTFLIQSNKTDKSRSESGPIQQLPESSAGSSKPPFIYGVAGNPESLDPVDTLGGYSRDVFLQCLETLVSYDLSSHPNYVLKPMLAEYWIWAQDNKSISFKIREDVLFHDGTPLNADAAKWNFERLMYFCNPFGTLPINETSWQALSSEFFYLANGTFIFDSFESDGAYNFTINLNIPFGPLLDLLTFSATYVLSPASTPRYSYLDLNTDKIIGTGPFIYDGYIPDVEVRFHANEDYWGGKADIEDLIFMIIQDNTARMVAALNGQLDYVGSVPSSYIDILRSSPDIHVEDVGEGLCYFYFWIYCGPRDYAGDMILPGDPQYQRNNATLRRALALAVNYLYIIEEIQAGAANYGVPAVPRAMPGHNDSVYMGYNYTFTEGVRRARELMQKINSTAASWDVNYPGVNEAEWTSANLLGRNLIIDTWNNDIFIALSQLFIENFELIGVKVSENVITNWEDYLNLMENTPWVTDGSSIGWCPDYFSPYSMIDPLFNWQSIHCASQINDTSPGGLTEMMMAAVAETNYTKQLDIWGDIQSYLFDVNRETPATCTHIPTYTYFLQQVHHISVTGFPYNSLNRVYFYPCKSNRRVPGYFYLTSDAGDPETDGAFNLTWTFSQGADNYSLYTTTDSITYTTNDLTILADQNATSPHPISGLSPGTYHYIAVAYNKTGFTFSNWLSIIVSPPSEPDGEEEEEEEEEEEGEEEEGVIPGYNVFLFIVMIGLSFAILIYLRVKKLKEINGEIS